MRGRWESVGGRRTEVKQKENREGKKTRGNKTGNGTDLLEVLLVIIVVYCYKHLHAKFYLEFEHLILLYLVNYSFTIPWFCVFVLHFSCSLQIFLVFLLCVPHPSHLTCLVLVLASLCSYLLFG